MAVINGGDPNDPYKSLGWSSKQPGIQIRLHLGTPRPGDEDPVELQIEGKVTVIPARNPTNVIAYSVAWAWEILKRPRLQVLFPTKIVDLLYPPSQDAIVISRILRVFFHFL